MKFARTTLLTVIALNIIHLAFAASAPFSKGETIHYDIKKFGIKTGEATLTYIGSVEVQGTEALFIMFTARGPKFLDEEQIYVDVQTFHPLLIKRNLNIFGKEEKITEYYDAQKGKVHIVKVAKGKTTEQTIEKDGRFDNIYGFIYRYRQSGQFQENEALNIHLPTRDLIFKFSGQESLKIDGKKLNAGYIQSTPKEYGVWFDIGPERTPLRIDGALGFGNLSMVITDR